MDYYTLHIAEDDGEVDWDFPCLDNKESVTKFTFNFLALVESDPKKEPPDRLATRYFLSQNHTDFKFKLLKCRFAGLQPIRLKNNGTLQVLLTKLKIIMFPV